MRPLFCLALLLAACTAKEEDSGTDTTDSGPTDTDDSGDTDEVVVDDCDEFALNGSLAFAADALVPEGEITMALFPMNFDSENAFDVSTMWERTAITGVAGESVSFSWCLGTPPEEHYQADDGGGDTDTDTDTVVAEAAPYLIGGMVDSNGDEAFTPGEALVHGEYAFLLHVRGAVPGDFAEYGVQLGWNRLVVTFPDGEIVNTALSDGDELSLNANLLLNDPGPLPGVLESSHEGAVRAGLYLVEGNEEAEDNLLGESVAVDATEAGAEFLLATAPPADHLVDSGGLRVAMYAAIAWDDAAPDQTYTEEGDGPLLAASVFSQSPVYAIYLEPIDFSSVYYVSAFGRAGWGLFTDQYVTVPWDEGVSLHSPG